jgi:hypothetical protein
MMVFSSFNRIFMQQQGQDNSPKALRTTLHSLDCLENTSPPLAGGDIGEGEINLLVHLHPHLPPAYRQAGIKGEGRILHFHHSWGTRPSCKITEISVLFHKIQSIQEKNIENHAFGL